MKLHNKILIGLLAGAFAGAAANAWLDVGLVEQLNRYLANPLGQIFLRLLFMVVMPLVFASIALGIAGIGDVRRVGRIGGLTLGFFVVTTAMAVAVGLALVALIRPGELLAPAMREELLATYAQDAASKVDAAKSSGLGIDMLIGIVTRNPLKSAVDGDMLGVIFFGIMFGAAITLLREDRGKTMLAWLEALNEMMEKIVGIAMRLAPYGVAGLIFGVTSRFGFALLEPLGAYVGVVLAGLLFHSVVTLALIVRFAIGMSPVLFFSRIREALVTGFSTSSSAATLPTNITAGEQNLGLPSRIAGFVYPLGATMCSSGTALFEGITVLFLCQVFGVELSLVQMATVMVLSIITGVGVAGVPGGSIPLIVGVLAMFGVPGEGIAIVLGVDRILDMARTAVNVLGDHIAAAWVARVEGEWTAAKVPAVPGAPLDDSPDWPKG